MLKFLLGFITGIWLVTLLFDFLDNYNEEK